MIVFFSDKSTDSKTGHPFADYLSPALRPMGPLSLADRFRSFEINPHILSPGDKLEKPEFLELLLLLQEQKREQKNNSPVFLNAWLIPSRDQVGKLASQILSLKESESNQGWGIRSGEVWVAFRLPDDFIEKSRHQKAEITLERMLARLGENDVRVMEGDYRILTHLHQWVNESNDLLSSDIDDYIQHWGLKKSSRYPNLWHGKGVVIHPSVDISGGPVMINDGATVGSFTCLEGPLIVGKNSVVSPHAYLKHAVVGHTVKVGGEVHSSIINDYSNKAHYGYLGNSYVGEWVNIGAGVVTSNLKNNYSTVSYRDSQERKIDSGGIFLGAMVGDFAKIGINSSLAPGTIVGSGASVSGELDGYIENFAIWNYGKQEGFIKLSSFLKTKEQVFSRRNFQPSPEYWERLTSIYRNSFPNHH